MKPITASELRSAMLEKLFASGLTAQDAKKLQVTPITAAEAQAHKLPRPTPGMKIPYFTSAGKLSGFFRVRYLQDTRSALERATGQKPLRYVQPPGSITEVYAPPLGAGENWKALLADAAEPLIITEGELKAAAACAAGFPTLGLGGVWMFAKPKSSELLPLLADTAWAGRHVYVIYDSDASVNPNVAKAERRLCEALGAVGARPFICRLPNTGGHKVGLDDYLLAYGADALRTLIDERAELFPRIAAMHEFNEKVLFVHDPGLIYERETKLKMSYYNFTTMHYATDVHTEITLDTKGAERVRQVPTAPAWVKWAGRAAVYSLTYRPGSEELFVLNGRMYVNTWPGWGVLPAEPKPVNKILPWTRLLDHLFDYADAEHRRWFEQWCAYPLQHPGTKMSTAVVCYGIMTGTGKSLIGYSMMKIYGKNATEINEAALHDPRNAWAEAVQFVMADEITGGDKRGLADRLKTMITQKEIRIDQKYVPSYTLPDCINYYFTSNHPDSFFLEDADRRLFIHEVRAGRLPQKFYDDYIKWLEKDGAAELFHHLLSLDLGDFHPQAAAPETAAKKEMILNNHSDLAMWVRILKEEPDSIVGEEHNGRDVFTNSELLMMYDPTGSSKLTANGLGRELKRVQFLQPNHGLGVRTPRGKQRLYIVRNLDKWKDAKLEDIVANYVGAKDGEKKRKY